MEKTEYSLRDEKGLVHILKGMLLSHQKVGSNAIYSNIEGTNHNYVRESKSDRGRQIYEITEKLILKSDTKELISKTHTESQTLKRHLVLQKESHCKEGLNQDAGINMDIPGGQTVKNPTAMQETWVQSLGREDPLEEEMATCSSILVQKIPWKT